VCLKKGGEDAVKRLNTLAKNPVLRGGISIAMEMSFTVNSWGLAWGCSERGRRRNVNEKDDGRVTAAETSRCNDLRRKWLCGSEVTGKKSNVWGI